MESPWQIILTALESNSPAICSYMAELELKRMTLKFHPATARRWKDLEALFGQNGACAGCWCMWWKQSGSEFERQKGERNKRALKRIIDSGKTPGLLAYDKNRPVGWCAIEPREAYPRLERSRSLKRFDDNPVWSLVCFFVAKDYRKKGVSVELLKGVIAYAKQKGAKIIEGYPAVTNNKKLPDPWVWTGLLSTFLKAGFKDVLRRSKSRPIMRYYVEKNGVKYE